jgi:hypothetical protein
MACAVLQNIAVQRQELELEEDMEFLELVDGEDYIAAGAELVGVTARDYIAQTYFA